MGKGAVVWIGFWGNDNDVVVATSLKGLCDEIGASYATAAVKKVEGDWFELMGSVFDGRWNVAKVWRVRKCGLIKIGGRGRRKGDGF